VASTAPRSWKHVRCRRRPPHRQAVCGPVPSSWPCRFDPQVSATRGVERITADHVSSRAERRLHPFRCGVLHAERGRRPSWRRSCSQLRPARSASPGGATIHTARRRWSPSRVRTRGCRGSRSWASRATSRRCPMYAGAVVSARPAPAPVPSRVPAPRPIRRRARPCASMRREASPSSAARVPL